MKFILFFIINISPSRFLLRFAPWTNLNGVQANMIIQRSLLKMKRAQIKDD